MLRNHLEREPYDLLVLVNPNNPTGRLVPRASLAPWLAALPSATRVWIDEAYIDYAGREESVESLAAGSANTVVCKSMSKVYALSGARAAYLCGPPRLMAGLRALTPPWAVSLPAQVVAVAALGDGEYYTRRYAETAQLRATLAADLRTAVPGLAVHESEANYLLCDLPAGSPDVLTVLERCRLRDVWLRCFADSLGDTTLRIAVKDAAANQRIVAALAGALRPRWPA